MFGYIDRSFVPAVFFYVNPAVTEVEQLESQILYNNSVLVLGLMMAK